MKGHHCRLEGDKISALFAKQQVLDLSFSDHEQNIAFTESKTHTAVVPESHPVAKHWSAACNEAQRRGGGR